MKSSQPPPLTQAADATSRKQDYGQLGDQMSASADIVGARINWKFAGIATAAETFIGVTSLTAQAGFALQFGSSLLERLMMTAAPVACVAVELARVPIALQLRTQRSYLLKIACAFAIVDFH